MQSRSDDESRLAGQVPGDWSVSHLLWEVRKINRTEDLYDSLNWPGDAWPGICVSFHLASPFQLCQVPFMKTWLASCFWSGFFCIAAVASTISVVPIYEPISLHGTDVDGAVSDIGETLQAVVMPRPMALTGAFPEDLVAAIRSPHLIPTNNPNYKVQEANLLVICNINTTAQMVNNVLAVKLDVTQLSIPEQIDLTSRQILKLTILALRKTLEEYQRGQTKTLSVSVMIDGAEDGKASLRDLATNFTIAEAPGGN
ncbi:MAG: hypothetical protein HC845_06100 [Akkermansiaceae bacterium]|nr:hypothetical protein [Akkermansiaceae bacterium]